MTGRFLQETLFRFTWLSDQADGMRNRNALSETARVSRFMAEADRLEAAERMTCFLTKLVEQLVETAVELLVNLIADLLLAEILQQSPGVQLRSVDRATNGDLNAPRV